MDLKELISKLESIKNEGFIASLRKGSTGIGYTFESLLGLSETNIPIPDIGGRVEIKTTRKGSKSLVTLFTFNRGVWKLRQKEVIEKYGYIDNKGRQALKSTIFYNKPNTLGLSLEIDDLKNIVNLFHSSGDLLASWDLYEVVGKFYSKLSRLLLVFADRRKTAEKEEFHYNEAYLLTNPQTRNFLEGFKNSTLGIDLRMHLKENNSVRNRGTGFRMNEIDMISLYNDRKKLI
jgi:hypothetical protein